MRGLDTRCFMAQTHILWRLDAKAASEQFLRVQRMAFEEGYKDAANGETKPPLMLKDEPCLEGQWLQGFWKYHDDQLNSVTESTELVLAPTETLDTVQGAPHCETVVQDLMEAWGLKSCAACNVWQRREDVAIPHLHLQNKCICQDCERWFSNETI